MTKKAGKEADPSMILSNSREKSVSRRKLSGIRLDLPPVESSDTGRVGNVVESERRDCSEHDSESGLHSNERSQSKA